MSTEKDELRRLREEKERKQKYTYDYNAKNYYRAVCLWPAARRGLLDAAIKASGAGSVSAYLAGLVSDDLRRRGLLDDGGAGAGPTDSTAASPDSMAGPSVGPSDGESGPAWDGGEDIELPF